MNEEDNVDSGSSTIELIEKIMDPKTPDEDLSSLVSRLKEKVPHPAPTDVIFYSSKPMTAQEVLKELMAYRPIQL